MLQIPANSLPKNGQLYFDSIVFDPAALKYLISQTGADKIMIGTDYPFGRSTTEVDLVLQTPELSNDDRTAILGECGKVTQHPHRLISSNFNKVSAFPVAALTYLLHKRDRLNQEVASLLSTKG